MTTCLPNGGKGAAAERIGRGSVLLLAVCYVAVYLAPLLRSGYFSDDRTNATITKGLYAWRAPLTHAALIREDIRHWLNSNRFAPLSNTFSRLLFYYMDQIVLYKLYLLLLTLASALLFLRVARRLGGDATVPLFAMLLLPMFFQFRPYYHDPLIALWGLVQILFILVLGSVALLQEYLSRRRRAWLAGSVLLYVLALLTYELAVPLLLLHVLAVHADRRSVRRPWAALAPFGAAALALTVLVVCLAARGGAADRYSGTAASFQPGRVARTYGLQVAAAAPLISIGHRDVGVTVRELADGLRGGAPALWLLSALFALGAAALWRGLRTEGRPAFDPALPAAGAILALVPAMPVAISVKYQEELRFGVGYTPVLIQCFGLALLLAWAVVRACRAIPRPAARGACFFGACLAACAVAMLNFCHNGLVVARANPTHDRNEALQAALASGMFDVITDNGTAVFSKNYLYWCEDYKYPIYYHTGKKLRCTTWRAYQGLVRKAGPAGIEPGREGVYMVAVRSTGTQDLAVVLGVVRRITYDPGTRDFRVAVSEYRRFAPRGAAGTRVCAESAGAPVDKPLGAAHETADGRAQWFAVSFGDEGVDWRSIRVL